MIFQTPVLFPGGVRSNLCYGLGEVPDDDLVDALTAAGLKESFLERESSALSVGQAQRVPIARALVRSPEMVLMDEPTSALDKDAAAKIEELIGGVADRGPGVVVVTHDLDQAVRIAAMRSSSSTGSSASTALSTMCAARGRGTASEGRSNLDRSCGDRLRRVDQGAPWAREGSGDLDDPGAHPTLDRRRRDHLRLRARGPQRSRAAGHVGGRCVDLGPPDERRPRRGGGRRDLDR